MGKTVKLPISNFLLDEPHAHADKLWGPYPSLDAAAAAIPTAMKVASFKFGVLSGGVFSEYIYLEDNGTPQELASLKVQLLLNPASGAVAGKILSLDNNLKPVWVEPSSTAERVSFDNSEEVFDGDVSTTQAAIEALKNLLDALDGDVVKGILVNGSEVNIENGVASITIPDAITSVLANKELVLQTPDGQSVKGKVGITTGADGLLHMTLTDEEGHTYSSPIAGLRVNGNALQYSNDGETWTTVQTFGKLAIKYVQASDPASGDEGDLALVGSTNAYVLKVYVGGSWVSVCDFGALDLTSDGIIMAGENKTLTQKMAEKLDGDGLSVKETVTPVPGAGFAINATSGKIESSALPNAKIHYISVSAGDKIIIDAPANDGYRITYGLYTSHDINSMPISGSFKNYPAGRSAISDLIEVSQSCYLVVYCQSVFTISRLLGSDVSVLSDNLQVFSAGSGGENVYVASHSDAVKVKGESKTLTDKLVVYDNVVESLSEFKTAELETTAGLSIDTTSHSIVTSSVTNANIKSIEVSKGDAIKVIVPSQLTQGRCTYGLFASTSVGSVSIGDIVNHAEGSAAFEEEFDIKEDGYFVIYSLNSYYVEKKVIKDFVQSFEKTSILDSNTAIEYNNARVMWYANVPVGGKLVVENIDNETEISASVNLYSVGSDGIATNIGNIRPYSKLSGVIDVPNNTDFIGIYFKFDDDAPITAADAINAYNVYIESDNDFMKDHIYKPKDNEMPLLYTGKSLDTTSKEMVSEFCTKPYQDMDIVIHIPAWLKVRFKTGLRNSNLRTWSNYYFNGDTVNFDYLAGGMQCAFCANGNANTPINVSTFEGWQAQGLICLAIQDAHDGNIFQRNFDAERYLGSKYASDGTSISKVPMIVHVSDIHSDARRLNSAYGYADYIGADLLINTGDNPYFNLDDGVEYIKEATDVHKTEYVNCIGNHDTNTTVLADIVAKNITPFATKYGYHKDSTQDITDVGYFFKDIAELKLRIISLNNYDGVTDCAYFARISQTQIEWFIDTLSSVPNNYGIIVCLHQAPTKDIAEIAGKTSFNDSTMGDGLYAIDSSYMKIGKIEGDPLGKIVDAFIKRVRYQGSYTQKGTNKTTAETISYDADFSSGISSSAEFIMFLNGHTHRDFVGYISDSNIANSSMMLNINVCSASPIRQATGVETTIDFHRDSNGVTQDAFNVYTIDRTAKTVKICRIGASVKKDLTETRAMVVNYAPTT